MKNSSLAQNVEKQKRNSKETYMHKMFKLYVHVSYVKLYNA